MISSFKIEPWTGFSNFARLQKPISKDGIQFWSVENAYMAAKTHDIGAKMRIAQMSPGQAKKFGRELQLRPDWEEVKVEIMRELLREKFSQPLFKVLLLSSGDEELVEGNWWHDQFWGNCECDKHKHIPGQNTLGKLLMEIREEIR